MKKVFGRFDGLLRIVIFTRDGHTNALVEYASRDVAAFAKIELDGKCIYDTGNRLRVQFSKNTCITVRFNNDKSIDLTRPELPVGPPIPRAALRGG